MVVLADSNMNYLQKRNALKREGRILRRGGSGWMQDGDRMKSLGILSSLTVTSQRQSATRCGEPPSQKSQTTGQGCPGHEGEVKFDSESEWGTMYSG